MKNFKCIVCGKSEYKILKWPNILIAHWKINPGLAFNELVLGQRLPEEIYCCSNCPLDATNSYARCNNCKEFIHAKEYGNGFGYWLGYICPRCDSEIPTALNFTSKFILFLLTPILNIFKNRIKEKYQDYVKRKILKARPQYEKIIEKYKNNSAA